MNISTKRNRMEPVRGRRVVEAVRLGAPERLQSPPGVMSVRVPRRAPAGQKFGDGGPRDLLRSFHACKPS